MKPNKLTPGKNLMWESSRMMLPEHKQRIQQHQKELLKRNRVILDEQRLAEFSQIISDALNQNSLIKIQVFHPYHDSYFTGKIERILLEHKQIKLVNSNDVEWINFNDIIDIYYIDNE
ncbi:YolD-like family protein [Bacillus solimangrovi]|uniref:YolD-like family protein n=1 Tax=Bacillus solimangrovi TaxID=1305675 RepID=A0A1E5LKE4_9BACI|nr:YolD-like family protein [Bacillus solimangrovi]OEH94545.1 hypothetical protein BFG57_07705 [Bacillus solimangrovi]